MPSRRFGPILLCAVIALAAGAVSTQVLGQTIAQRLAARDACMASAKLLCPTQAAARDRDGVKACLVKNLDKVTPACATALKAVLAAQGAKP